MSRGERLVIIIALYWVWIVCWVVAILVSIDRTIPESVVLFPWLAAFVPGCIAVIAAWYMTARLLIEDSRKAKEGEHV